MAEPLGSRAAARRTRILEAAGTLFARQGIERSTVEDLLEEAALSRATFYRAFTGLDEVIEALYADYERHVIDRLTRTLETIDARKPTSIDAIVAGVLDDQSIDPALMRAMLREELRPGRGDLAKRKRVRGQVRLLHRWWEATTGVPADDELILSLIMMLQFVGLVVAESPRSAQGRRLREALRFICHAVVKAYIAEHRPDAATDSSAGRG